MKRKVTALDAIPEEYRDRELHVYCDGSGTHHEDSPACIGVVVADNVGTILCESSAFICQGSNNVAELYAIRCALYLIRQIGTAKQKTRAVIYSDSNYAMGIADGSLDARANRDLAKAVKQSYKHHRGFTIFQHVPGHRGILGNELADWLAGRARHEVLALRKSVGFALGLPWASKPFRKRPVVPLGEAS